MFNLKLKLRVRWKDSRLEYRALNENDHLNMMTPTDKKEIWMPVITFESTAQRERARFNTIKAIAKVKVGDGKVSFNENV